MERERSPEALNTSKRNSLRRDELMYAIHVLSLHVGSQINYIGASPVYHRDQGEWVRHTIKLDRNEAVIRLWIEHLIGRLQSKAFEDTL
ncbi:hypothetical protein OUZ56_024998 [Daphnia magna]|uniref:Uncharacterized protein n=1 Tax=Daphnia magna TaxID=35525 RepID=A0ABQ9ZIM0_9CRUS|nr:hypothetical protein OUZ56_024998 [Daphnia magna]